MSLQSGASLAGRRNAKARGSATATREAAEQVDVEHTRALQAELLFGIRVSRDIPSPNGQCCQGTSTVISSLHPPISNGMHDNVHRRSMYAGRVTDGMSINAPSSLILRQRPRF